VCCLLPGGTPGTTTPLQIQELLTHAP
jgi:hypothetical protein